MKRILVVDDETVVCEILGKFFKSKGYTVYTAYDGLSAMDVVTKVKPPLVLLDIIMPGISGLELLQQIKKHDADCCVIMITGVCDEEVARLAIRWGACHYMTKPLNLNYLETCAEVKIIDLLCKG